MTDTVPDKSRHPNLTGGSRKGIPNKTTASIKQAFKDAFDGMGGTPALIAWGEKNPSLFYPLASKLIPTEVVGKDGDPLIPPSDDTSTAARVAAILASARAARDAKES